MRTLTPKELEEFKTLWTQLQGRSHDDDEGPEHDRIHSRLRALTLKSTQILMCCQAIQDYPIIGGGVTEQGEWYWYLNGHPEIYSRMFMERIETTPKPVFCPFCATALPKMVRQNLVGVPVGNEADVDYCSSCHERIMCCICLPPTANWVPA